MIRCGFFNSVNNDRAYDAEDMGKIFEGIISDGVFNNINSGNSFKVTKNNNTMTVNVAAGKAWFYNRYFEIVGNETITLRNGDVNPRWDAICIKIDNSSSVREGSLYAYEGEPNADPVKPTITSTDDIKLIPIAYIKIPANAVNVNNAVITSTIGTSLCPYSETTLDPRHGMYIYEGESSVDPYLNEYREYDFYFDLNETIQNHGGDIVGRKGNISLSPNQLGVTDFNNVKIIPFIKRAYSKSGSQSLFSYTFVLSPLYCYIDNNLCNIGTKLHEFTQNGEEFNIPTPDSRIEIKVIVIDLGGAQNE